MRPVCSKRASSSDWFSGAAEGVEDKGHLNGEKGAALAGQQIVQLGIVMHVEAQLGPRCAGTDGREIELGQLRTDLGFDCCFHTAKIRKNIGICKAFY